jgi:hypothetical protein
MTLCVGNRLISVEALSFMADQELSQKAAAPVSGVTTEISSGAVLEHIRMPSDSPELARFKQVHKLTPGDNCIEIQCGLPKLMNPEEVEIFSGGLTELAALRIPLRIDFSNTSYLASPVITELEKAFLLNRGQLRVAGLQRQPRELFELVWNRRLTPQLPLL